ncbi:protein lifeguard 1 [Austrofundulus limnaeus]|uniref:Protein lifeguard 1 n=1 Tax=Austrofundulus limnaeus TaxID=52670 RepID=A0A2I4ATL0_AUSLI|nr:PREDICTED: protein lifeguard 1-like [Austrofundulus limnaeus]
MDQSSSSANGGSGPSPPPYSPHCEENSYTGTLYQVGKGNIVVVSPPGFYSNTAHPEHPAEFGGNQHHDQTPLPYSFGSQAESDDSSFSNDAIRRGFIRKVYLTLMIQLLFTVGIICAFLYWDTLRNWVWDNYWFSFTMMSVTLVLIVALSCCGDVRRQVPLNFIALGLFTLAEGLMLGSVAVYFDVEAVLWAMAATALVSFGMSLFAMQSKWDFTLGAGFMWALAWSFISFALLCAIIRSQYIYIFFSFLGTLLFSLYLVFDTHLILGGKHRNYEISPEEYVFATLNLYLDITTLFLFILQCIGLCR